MAQNMLMSYLHGPCKNPKYHPCNKKLLTKIEKKNVVKKYVACLEANGKHSKERLLLSQSDGWGAGDENKAKLSRLGIAVGRAWQKVTF